MPKPLVVIAEVRAARGKGDALAAFLPEQVAAVLEAEPGCLEYQALRSVADPELFVFYEVYADEAAFEFHRTSKHLATFRERRDKLGLTAGPAKVASYYEVDTD
jgi:quinol monooxygenase YgiN